MEVSIIFCSVQDLSEKLRKKLTQTDSMKVLHQRKVAEMVKSLREEMVCSHEIPVVTDSDQLNAPIPKVDFDSLLGTGLEDAHEVVCACMSTCVTYLLVLCLGLVLHLLMPTWLHTGH